MSLDDDARAELKQLEAIGRLRSPRVVGHREGPQIALDGANVLDFASNDYLSLATDKRLVEAAKVALDEHGVGATASRLITGNHRLHVELEEALADWLRAGAVRLFGSGYAANVGTLGALVGPDDVVFSDELNHASLIDGCRLARAQVVVYPHGDLRFLDEKLRERAGRRRLIASETLFSMDGDIADIAELARLAKQHGVALMLDEAHAIGARGPEGRGVAAAVGVVPDLLVGTCGKALGTSGAFVATTPAISKLLWNRARSLVFSTATPPAIAAATIASIEIVRGADGDDRRRSLAERAEQLRARVSISRTGNTAWNSTSDDDFQTVGVAGMRSTTESVAGSFGRTRLGESLGGSFGRTRSGESIGRTTSTSGESQTDSFRAGAAASPLGNDDRARMIVGGVRDGTSAPLAGDDRVRTISDGVRDGTSAPLGGDDRVRTISDGVRDGTSAALGGDDRASTILGGVRDGTRVRLGGDRASTILGGVRDGAIAPLLVGDDRRVMELSARLLERRIFVQGIRYPTVPEATARLRISVNAGHRFEDIELLAIALDDAMSHSSDS
ncbi:MAG: aminotransferase class I/II-fold pyridoxal phosphate-dependent enzyme [Kofleriaceae bacterium]